MGADPDDAHFRTGAFENLRGVIAVEMTLAAATTEEVIAARCGEIVNQQQAQVLDNRDGAGGELALGAIFSDDQLVAHFAFAEINILGFEGTGFVDPTGRIETDAKQCAVSFRMGVIGEPFAKQKLDFCDGENFGATVTVDFHCPLPEL